VIKNATWSGMKNCASALAIGKKSAQVASNGFPHVAGKTI